MEVDPERLPRWLAGFEKRHGTFAVRPHRLPSDRTQPEELGPAGTEPLVTRTKPAGTRLEDPWPAGASHRRRSQAAGRPGGGTPGGPDHGSGGSVLEIVAADGTVARLYPPPGAAGGADLAGFVADAQAPRRLGLLLARKAAAVVGVADGETLVTSKVGSWYVQGRTAAGGQSQQRFARRRANQATAAAGKAADLAARLLLPAAGPRAARRSSAPRVPADHGGAGATAAQAGPGNAPGLAAVVTGGDRATVESILADPRLAPLVTLRADRHLEVPTPNLAVLQEAVRAARAVTIHLPSPSG